MPSSLQLLIVALLLAVATGTASAQPKPSWQGQAREIDFDADAAGFRFVSTRPGHEDEERLSGVFQLAPARFHWGFQPNRSAPTAESGLQFSALLEWRDLDGDGAFGVGDEVVRRQALSALANATIEVFPQPPTGRIVHVSYPFPGAPPGPLDPLTGRRLLHEGGVTLSFHLLSGGASLGVANAQGNRHPLEVRIEKWPMSRNDTRLGLELLLQSAGPMHLRADRWLATHAPVIHDLAWSTSYARNGTGLTAHVAALERPGDPGFSTRSAQTTLLAAYDRGAILHSFSLGTEPQAQARPDLSAVTQTLAGEPLLFLAGAATCALAVGLTSARRLRRRH